MKYLNCLIAITLLAGCTSATEVIEPEQGGKVQTQTTWNAVGAIMGEPGVPVNGAAELRFGADSGTSIKIQVNIEPEKEMYYQAWLTNESQDEWITVGTLRNRFDDVRHYSNFETSQDLRRLTRVVITKQAIGTESRDSIVAQANLVKR